MKLRKLNALVKKENAISLENSKARILEANTNDFLLRNTLTVTRWNQLRAGDITLEEARKFAIEREARKAVKKLAEKLNRLERAENRLKILSVIISVEWKKSYCWGYNPTATIRIVKRFDNGMKTESTYNGHASGCGYDKLSAAIAQALNQDPDLFGLLCEVKERAIRKGYKALPVWNDDNRNCIHYGAGYGPLPYFEGGVGHSLFGVLETCGLKCIASDRNGKYHDFFAYSSKNSKGV